VSRGAFQQLSKTGVILRISARLSYINVSKKITSPVQGSGPGQPEGQAPGLGLNRASFKQQVGEKCSRYGQSGPLGTPGAL